MSLARITKRLAVATGLMIIERAWPLATDPRPLTPTEGPTFDGFDRPTLRSPTALTRRSDLRHFRPGSLHGMLVVVRGLAGRAA